MKKLSTLSCRGDVKDNDLEVMEFEDEEDEKW